MRLENGFVATPYILKLRRDDRKPENHESGAERLKRAAALPDDQIDTSDIPEVTNLSGWVRVHQHPEHPLHRVLSRLLSIRLPEPDIALAQKLAEAKGLPYQTYIKSLLHEALERERAGIERR